MSIPTITSRRLVGMLLIALAAGCPGAAGDGADAGVAATELGKLDINVEIDSKPMARIDAARIDSTSPDRMDASRRVWRLRTLLGELYSGRTATIAIQTEGGGRQLLVDDEDRGAAREPMLAVDASGAVRLALIRADEPFPPFEHRAAIARVTHIFIDTRAATPADRPPAPASNVRIEVVGAGSAVVWTHADLDRVARLPYTNDDAESREAWSLRDLARVLVGAGARVTAVDGEGRQVALDPQRWGDPALLPVLRVTRRGLVKFQWLTTKLAHLDGDTGLRGVTGLRIERP